MTGQTTGTERGGERGRLEAEGLDLYRRLLLVRLTEEAIARAYPAGEMRCPVHLSLGQEAVPAGAAAALAPEDALFSGHRSHGPYLARGGDLRAMLAELHGRAAGCCGGRGGSMHLTDPEAGFWGAVPIVAATVPIAAGAALAFKTRREPRVAMVFLGEGATEEGVFHESLQYAAVWRLPVVFVCENNGFSVNTPLAERRPPEVSLPVLARSHGLFADQGDGNDALQVFDLCRRAVERARSGGGASFLEFATYRWVEHCGPADDHHLPCRDPEAFRHWKNRCPVAALERRLAEQGLAEAGELARLRAEIEAEVTAALAWARQAPFPDPAEATRGVHTPDREADHA